MLIEFTVGNFRSIRERVTLSMVASSLVSKDKRLDEENVFSAGDGLRLLKCAAIYGANGSGKSNLFKALRFMRQMVANSSRESQAEEPIPVQPFALSAETMRQPSLFECVFLQGGVEFRYGFEAGRTQVVSEWLYHRPGAREVRLFTRDHGAIAVGRGFREGKGLEGKTRENALFLSVVAQFNGEIARGTLHWFDGLSVSLGLPDTGHRQFTTKNFANGRYRAAILRLLRQLDLGIHDLEIEDPAAVPGSASAPPFPEPKELPWPWERPKRQAVRAIHRTSTAGGEGEFHAFDLDRHESEGTKRLFAISGPIVDALTHGRVLFLDEFDARLHPLISCNLLKLFCSREHNPNNAQLIVATHDTNLLSGDLFRRDQVWFTEKDVSGATKLVSLAEYRVRNDASFERDYLRGRYGAIPFPGDLAILPEEERG